MILLKRLDRFILSKFLQLFVGAFFVCQFVFMMQFTWRWIDDLVGKGLTADILAQFFWYMGITLVPQSLPLSVLLASLITFGNMGETLELLSMKAAGISLFRVMRPILLLLLPLTALSFHFQNSISPSAQRSLRTLLTSIKIAQPAVEIPVGVFYNGVKGTNLYVGGKNTETGMLYNTIIYKTDQGFDRAQIILADSAKLEITADKMHLRLTLWAGEQFQDLQSTTTGSATESLDRPYDRETFVQKTLLIDFDSNFNQLNADELGQMPQAKNMAEIRHDIDSMHHWLDSVTIAGFQASMAQLNAGPKLSVQDSLRIIRKFRAHPESFDRIVARTPKAQLEAARTQAGFRIEQMINEQSWRSEMVADQEYYIRKHWVEWHTKLTFSLACLLFFFVGAPLGAIIRKGGLGLPTVISVGIFIAYYIINTSGMKTARDGNINMVVGMWVSTFILLPAGAYLTFMSNRDSVVFNADAYIAGLRRFLGLRTTRHLLRKEVIITPPRYALLAPRLRELAAQSEHYLHAHRLALPPNYVRIFFRAQRDTEALALTTALEELVLELANTESHHLLQLLNQLPQIDPHAHSTPFARPWKNQLCGALLPLGLLLWLRMWRFRLRLRKDLRLLVPTLHALHALTTQMEREARIEAPHPPQA